MKSNHVPTRMCTICRERFPKHTLNRYVIVDNVAISDEKKTMSGRGIYVCDKEGCNKKWMKRTS